MLWRLLVWFLCYRCLFCCEACVAVAALMLFDAIAFAAAVLMLPDVVMSLEWLLLPLLSCSGRLLLLLVLITVLEAFRLASGARKPLEIDRSLEPT